MPETTIVHTKLCKLRECDLDNIFIVRTFFELADDMSAIRYALNQTARAVEKINPKKTKKRV